MIPKSKSKSVKKSVKRGVRVLRVSHALEAREKKLLASLPFSLTVFSLVPDLSFDSSRVLEYAKILTVLQSIFPDEAVS